MKIRPYPQSSGKLAVMLAVNALSKPGDS
jgi:hypothetical protein